jgi:hypothetical protein
MARRSTPQSKTDDLAFPVRVKIAIPPLGLGRMTNLADEWLKTELGPRRWALHSQQGLGGTTAAYYFRTAEDAQRFVEAFPDLELADGVRSTWYRAPGPASP